METATPTLPPTDAEIDDGPVRPVVLEGHGQPLGVLRDGEGDIDIGLLVLIGDQAPEFDLVRARTDAAG
jgi:hypothetical protein